MSGGGRAGPAGRRAPGDAARGGAREPVSSSRLHVPSSDARDRYRAYLGSDSYRRERAEKARVVARVCGGELRRADRVADLGTGTGMVKKELENIVDKPIHGFDIEKSFMEVGERMAVADVTRLPVEDGGLDFAVLNHLYEHVDDQAGLFRELRRVLAPGGAAYVSAGSRWAVMEPHYRLPFLSWLPRRLADLYLRVTGRGEAYRGIRFLGYGRLTGLMRDAGLRVEDRTLEAVDDLIGETWGAGWARLWRAARALPEAALAALLRVVSPQWFFVLHKPAARTGGREAASGRRAGKGGP